MSGLKKEELLKSALAAHDPKVLESIVTAATSCPDIFTFGEFLGLPQVMCIPPRTQEIDPRCPLPGYT
jgi:hypothetical protein